MSGSGLPQESNSEGFTILLSKFMALKQFMNHAKLNLVNLIPEAATLDRQTFLLVNLEEHD